MAWSRSVVPDAPRSSRSGFQPCSARCPLTLRELAVLSAVAEGLTLPQVGARLRIRRGTAANYVTAALAKLGTPNRTAAVVLALQRSWLLLESIDVISQSGDGARKVAALAS